MSHLPHEPEIDKAIEHLRHYLPSQAALKDFIHHNTLHAFDKEPFHKACEHASAIFGYKTYLTLDEYRELYAKKRISQDAVNKSILKHLQKNAIPASQENIADWNYLIHKKRYEKPIESRLFQLRNLWKENYHFNTSKVVTPLLFRLLSAYLDQGISNWRFPVIKSSFIESLREVEKSSFQSIFSSERVKKLLFNPQIKLSELLAILIGDENFYEQYLFDQQFSHPGWSGFVAVVEKNPHTLLDKRTISLKELIIVECLLEIDALDKKYGTIWKPLLYNENTSKITPLFAPVEHSELFDVLSIWQEAYEWSYYSEVLTAIEIKNTENKALTNRKVSFQALLCIDDREYSLRRHIETIDPDAKTFGTPGFFGVEFYFKPAGGRFYTKSCPAPLHPLYVIKELKDSTDRKKDIHLHPYSHGLLRGGLITGTIGLFSAIRLFFNVFKPTLSPLAVNSFQHMDKSAPLQIDETGEYIEGLKVGFSDKEMADRVEKTLKSIGLTTDFASIVYVIGHGGSSVNNTYYAGYDCGACSGRPGSVNARVFAYMANKKTVRNLLKNRGIIIPDNTVFIGAMHDTTRDEIEYYIETPLNAFHQHQHKKNSEVIEEALERNAYERAYRFENISLKQKPSKVHQKVKLRSISIFEPRPEWNHTDNALCLVGGKNLYDGIFLDKRPFINSYDWKSDATGNILYEILSAAIPVCGGINLEYYFSRVDQLHLGSGSKLPHNVVGLFAVNTGIEGDLRTGLPSQMIEIHEPIRLLFIVEQMPEVVMAVLTRNPTLYRWVKNNWVHFVVRNLKDNTFYLFEEEDFKPLKITSKALPVGINDEIIRSVVLKEKVLSITN